MDGSLAPAEAPAPIAGPVLRRSGGYAFDTWTGAEGLQCGYPYRRIEDAIRARRVIAGQSGMVLCGTVDEFGALIDVARGEVRASVGRASRPPAGEQPASSVAR